MWETLWGLLTTQNINASATVVNALAAVILAVITGVYTWQNHRLVHQNKTLVNIEAERSAFEANRAELESRPYLEVRFIDWGVDDRGPCFEVIDVGKGPAVRVRLDNPNDLAWLESNANVQGFTTISAGLPPARFSFLRPPALTPEGKPAIITSCEFRIRYNDASGFHEFADKWCFGIKNDVSYLVRVNATTLKTKPLEAEDYVLQTGPRA